jgi:hypothetical protein
VLSLEAPKGFISLSQAMQFFKTIFSSRLSAFASSLQQNKFIPLLLSGLSVDLAQERRKTSTVLAFCCMFSFRIKSTSYEFAALSIFILCIRVYTQPLKHIMCRRQAHLARTLFSRTRRVHWCGWLEKIERLCL